MLSSIRQWKPSSPLGRALLWVGILKRRYINVKAWSKPSSPRYSGIEPGAVLHSFIHSFILSFFPDISITPLHAHYTTQRRSRLQHWYCVGVNAPKRYRQLWVKDLAKIPTWRLAWDSNLRHSGRKAPNLPLSNHATHVLLSLVRKPDTPSFTKLFRYSVSTKIYIAPSERCYSVALQTPARVRRDRFVVIITKRLGEEPRAQAQYQRQLVPERMANHWIGAFCLFAVRAKGTMMTPSSVERSEQRPSALWMVRRGRGDR